MKGKNFYLVTGGILSFSAALMHVLVIVGGPYWYRFFGAGEQIATMAEQGSWIPGVITASIAFVFSVWGLYAFSGARVFRRLPLLKPALVIISAIYLMRGLAVIPAMIIMPEKIDAFLVWSSLVSVMFGLAYVIGTWQEWSSLSMKNTG